MLWWAYVPRETTGVYCRGVHPGWHNILGSMIFTDHQGAPQTLCCWKRVFLGKRLACTAQVGILDGTIYL